jgi:hypothetical protein
VSGVVIFLTTGRLTGVAADTVIGGEVEGMLFVTVWVIANEVFFAVNTHGAIFTHHAIGIAIDAGALE